MNKSKKFFECVIFFIFGITSGMPLALTGSTFSLRLLDLGVKKETIGILSLLAIGYSMKFLYAPLLDYFRIPYLKNFLLKRLDWVLLFLITGFIGMMICSNVTSSDQIVIIGVGALIIGLSSAAFDTVIDGFRVSIVSKDRQGLIASIFVYGYRVGMMISGAGALFIADSISWKLAYLIMAITSITLGILAIIGSCIIYRNKIKADMTFDIQHGSLRKIKNIFLDPFLDLLKKDHIIIFFIMIALFKITDVYVGSMTNPFLIELGFTKSEIATIVKLFGFIATLVGAGVGGYMSSKFSVKFIVLGSIIMQICANNIFALQYYFGHDRLALSILMSIENFSSAISNTVLVFILSRACNIKFSGTQYAVMTSLTAFSRTTLSIGSGYLASYVGWKYFFVCAGMFEIPSFLMALYLIKKKVL